MVSARSKACLVLPCLLTGGTEVATLDTATALQALGYRVSVIVYFDETDPAMLAAFKQAGIGVTLLGLPRAGGAVIAARLALALGKALLKLRPSLVWLQYMTPTLVPLLVGRLFARHLIAAVHVAARHYNPGGLRRLRWLASWWCSQLVCVSHTTARGILGVQPPERLQQSVCVIPNALDMQAVAAAIPHNWREQLGLTEHQSIIGFVGRLAHNKGVDVLLQAAVEVNRQHPDSHWVIVGEGAERSHLQHLAAQAGLSGKVHFVGNLPREAVYAAMKGFDIAVVPSREEGFGLTALEAMACGVPLVASRVDALMEVVIEGVTGLLFNVDDAGSLAATLTQLLVSPELQRTLVAAATQHVEKTYSRQTFLVKLGSLLNAQSVKIEAYE